MGFLVPSIRACLSVLIAPNQPLLSLIVRRSYRMSIESDNVERVSRAAFKTQVSISDTVQK